MVDVADKLVYFQSVKGLDDPELSTDILAAHGWDLELAISSFTASSSPENPAAGSSSASFSSETVEGPQHQPEPGLKVIVAPGLARKLITLPVAIISGSLGLISGAGGVLSYSLGMIGGGGGSGKRSTGSGRERGCTSS